MLLVDRVATWVIWQCEDKASTSLGILISLLHLFPPRIASSCKFFQVEILDVVDILQILKEVLQEVKNLFAISIF
jgi:hypothetical protein